MGIISTYIKEKENISLEIAKKTEELYFNGLSYNAALRKAKEVYIRNEHEHEGKLDGVIFSNSR